MRKYFRKSMAVVLAFILCLSNIMIGAYATNSIPTVKYSDVQEDSWYYDAVNFVTAQGFMEGTDTGAFLPESSLTRSQFAKILYNMEGNPEAGNASTFTDVPTGKWYTDAVTWASNAGLVRGVGNGAFLPDESIRRQDLIVMTYRYAQYKECEITKRADLSSYQDAKNVAEYALDAVQWAVAEGIIVGSAGQLSPDREIQRCEAAELLMRLAEFITPSETEPTQPSENPSPVPGVPEEPDNPETDEVNLNEYGLAEEVEDGTILHAWCWNFNTIKEMIPQIAAAGFSAVQTSPINAIIEGENGGLQIYGSGKWYYHYQPTEYSEIGNYQLGTDEEFREMCEVAHQYGVKVIVDQVLNHMTSSESAISDTIKSEIDWGDAGEWGNPEKPWTHKSTGTQWSEEDRFEETQNSLSGLIEWNTQNENVQQYLLKWLETCVEAGADGFRYDAAKLIELPDDVSIKYPEYQFSSDFWPTVLQNGSSFQYGEVLQEGEPNHVYSSDLEGGYNDQDSSRLGNYQSQTFIAADGEEENMRTTLSFYGFRLRDAISNGNVNADFVGDMLVPEGASADRTVTWVESHDNYCNNASYSQLNEQQVIQAWAILAARKDGTPLFFSRPNNSSASNPWGDNQIGPEGSHFFMDAQVVAVNFFHNEMGNQDEYLSNPTGSDKVVMIERGTAGAVIVNLLGEDLVLDEAPVQSMADGTYTDQVYGSTFTVSNGKISGTVKVGKVAVVYNSKVDTPLEFEPEISLSVPTGDYLTDTMDVSVSIRGIDHATYQIDDGEEIPVANGDVITIGEDAQVDEAVTLKILGYSAAGELVAQASATYTKRLYKADTVVYIDDALCKARGWDQAYVYIWVSVDGSTMSNQGWPGSKAVLETEGKWAGYWKYVVPYELESISNLHVIVHGNKGDQIETNKMLISPGETKVLDADENWVDGSEVVNTGKVYALPGSGTEFYENTLNVTLHATNVTNASYRVGDSGEWMPFEDGQIITIGEDAADKENITVFMKGTNSDGSTVEESAVYIKHFIADKEEINVLFIGNSYTYYNDGIWSHFQKLAYEAGYNVQVDSVTIGSHHLYEFADPDEADPNGGPLVEEKLSTNHYDYVFLQEHSTYPITNYDTFASAATTLYNRIMEHNAECTVILYQTWGRETGSSNLTQDGRGWTNATMTYDLEYAYEKLGETLNVPVSPAGTAFHDVYVNNGSKIDLYDADQTHPTLEGTYLAALVHIGTVFGSDAIEAATAYTAGLPADTVQILKQAAIDAPEKAQAPHLYLTPAAEETTMDEAGLTLTLHAVNVARATYQINDGEEIEYVYGDKLTITPDEIINGKVTVTLKGENDAQEPVPAVYFTYSTAAAEHYLVLGWYAKTETSGLNAAVVDQFVSEMKDYLGEQGATEQQLADIVVRGYSGTVAEMGSSVRNDGDVDLLIGVGANIDVPTSTGGATAGVPIIEKTDGIYIGDSGKNRYIARLTEDDIAKLVYEWIQANYTAA